MCVYVHCVIILVGLAFTHVLANKDYYDVLPSIPTYIDQDDDDGSSRRFLVKFGGRIGQAIGASALSFVAFSFARSILQSLQSKQDPANLAPVYVNLEDELYGEIKADQSELWKSVMEMREWQAEQKSALESLQSARNTELLTLSNTLTSLDSKLSNVVSELDSLKSRINAVNIRQLEEIKQMQESLSDEVQKNTVEIQQVRDETARMLEDQQDLFAERLSIFKENLKKVILKKPNAKPPQR